MLAVLRAWVTFLTAIVGVYALLRVTVATLTALTAVGTRFDGEAWWSLARGSLLALLVCVCVLLALRQAADTPTSREWTIGGYLAAPFLVVWIAPILWLVTLLTI